MEPKPNQNKRNLFRASLPMTANSASNTVCCWTCWYSTATAFTLHHVDMLQA